MQNLLQLPVDVRRSAQVKGVGIVKTEDNNKISQQFTLAQSAVHQELIRGMTQPAKGKSLTL